MTGKELADQYRGTMADVLALRDRIRKLIDEQVAEYDAFDVPDRAEATARAMVGKYSAELGRHREELGRIMAVSDKALSSAIGCTIAALCGCGFEYLREHALGEGRRTEGLTAAIIATASLTRAVEVLLKRLDRVEEVA